MSFLNLFLMMVGPWLVVGAVAIPAALQWPRPVSTVGRPLFARPQPAGGGWR
jgi:hypothetical protein